MVEQRFTFAWDRPVFADASTHVSLFDGGTDPLHIVASGHGTDDATALSDLLTTLEARNESEEAISFVSEMRCTLTGDSARSRFAGSSTK